MIIHDAKLKFSQEQTKRSRTEYIIIHHSAGDDESVEEIHESHKNFGWIGIGYNYYIRKSGDIWKGRDEDTIAAHTEKYNSVSCGVCLAGNFEREQPTAAQLQSLQELLMQLRLKYPNAKIVGHRDLNATACPGRYLYKKIKELSKIDKEEILIKVFAHDDKVGISAKGKSYDVHDVPFSVLKSLIGEGSFSIKLKEK